MQGNHSLIELKPIELKPVEVVLLIKDQKNRIRSYTSKSKRPVIKMSKDGTRFKIKFTPKIRNSFVKDIPYKCYVRVTGANGMIYMFPSHKLANIIFYDNGHQIVDDLKHAN